MKPQNYKTEKTQIAGVNVLITTYQIGDKFYCKVQNIDPGATIARAEGSAFDDAYEIAINKVKARLTAGV